MPAATFCSEKKLSRSVAIPIFLSQSRRCARWTLPRGYAPNTPDASASLGYRTRAKKLFSDGSLIAQPFAARGEKDDGHVRRCHVVDPRAERIAPGLPSFLLWRSRYRDYLRLPRRMLAGVGPLAGAGLRSLSSGSSFRMLRASRMISRQDRSST